jgi:hypothetical protein
MTNLSGERVSGQMNVKIWTDKSGQAIFTYYDVEREGYRNATRDWVFTSSTVKQGVN